MFAKTNFGAAGLQESLVRGPAMASPGKADRRHSGGNSGIDPRRTVLDHQAARRRCTELFGGIEEQIWRRLTARDHRRAEQVLAKMHEKPG